MFVVTCASNYMCDGKKRAGYWERYCPRAAVLHMIPPKKMLQMNPSIAEGLLSGVGFLGADALPSQVVLGDEPSDLRVKQTLDEQEGILSSLG